MYIEQGFLTNKIINDFTPQLQELEGRVNLFIHQPIIFKLIPRFYQLFWDKFLTNEI